jgi:hypothetical protein
LGSGWYAKFKKKHFPNEKLPGNTIESNPRIENLATRVERKQYAVTGFKEEPGKPAPVSNLGVYNIKPVYAVAPQYRTTLTDVSIYSKDKPHPVKDEPTEKVRKDNFGKGVQ